MLISRVVDFDPITAEMGPGTTWHPYSRRQAISSTSPSKEISKIYLPGSVVTFFAMSIYAAMVVYAFATSTQTRGSATVLITIADNIVRNC